MSKYYVKTDMASTVSSSAQIVDGERFGMNVQGLDNQQFALNVAHWLSRLL